jgi:hypothetical protein
LIVSDNLPLHSTFPLHNTTNTTQHNNTKKHDKMITTNLQAPWRVIVSQYSNQKPSAWEITTKYGGVIAETNNLTNDTIPHLISAAPDLLSALERAEAALSWFINDEGECDIEALDEAKAVIAKAKGEA